MLEKEALLNLWNSAISFVEIMITSSNITTKIWLLEILYQISTKFNLKELLNNSLVIPVYIYMNVRIRIVKLR